MPESKDVVSRVLFERERDRDRERERERERERVGAERKSVVLRAKLLQHGAPCARLNPKPLCCSTLCAPKP